MLLTFLFYPIYYNSRVKSKMKTTKCTVCEEDFPSRNKLFEHLKESGHGGGKEKHKQNNTDLTMIKEDEVTSTSTNRPHLSKGNDAYYEYYLRQKIMVCSTNDDDDDDDSKNEQMWKEAYHKLRTPLPITYRVHQSHPLAELSARLLSSLIDENNNSNDCNVLSSASGSQFKEWSFRNDDDDAAAAKSTSTNTPNQFPRMIITSSVHRSSNSSKRSKDSDERSSIINDISPVLPALQELGAIHRQELVSAIPPFVLFETATTAAAANANASKGELVIADMCAAPGSKSLQLLDMLYTANTNNDDTTTTTTNIIPSGLLVVNDSDRNRIVTLCQRSRHVPRAPMLAINMDARYFAGLRRRLCDHDNWNLAGYKQKYDAVLCDVPCR